MEKFVVTCKVTYQVSEDEWERTLKVMNASGKMPIEEVFKWVEKIKGDKNTVMIHTVTN